MSKHHKDKDRPTSVKHSMHPGEKIEIKNYTILFADMVEDSDGLDSLAYADVIVRCDGKEVDRPVLAVDGTFDIKSLNATVKRIANRWDGSKMLHVEIKAPWATEVQFQKRFAEAK